MRSYLEKLQQEYETALHRNSSIPKGKSAEAEEALSTLSAARINYRAAAVEMVFSITILQQRKRFEILDNVSEPHCVTETCFAFSCRVVCLTNLFVIIIKRTCTFAILLLDCLIL